MAAFSRSVIQAQFPQKVARSLVDKDDQPASARAQWSDIVGPEAPAGPSGAPTKTRTRTITSTKTARTAKSSTRNLPLRKKVIIPPITTRRNVLAPATATRVPCGL